MVIHEYGDSSLPRVLLLHPMLADAGCMRVASDSMKEGYCFIIPDFSAHGEDTGVYQSGKKEAVLLDYLKAKGYTDIALMMGASMGGMIGLYLLGDGSLKVGTAVFEGASAYSGSWLLCKLVQFIFLSKHRKAAQMPLDEIERMMAEQYGDAFVYDGMITCSTLPGKAVCKLVWNMDKKKNDRYLQLALSGIPEDFSGRMLEVPVGTGVLTMPVYETLQEADITCLDYSPDTMERAKRQAGKRGLKNVRFLQGDVGKLPFDDGSFDLVLSLNGFHAFPNKEAAYSEVFRVLKPGGIFCGCFYVKGENKRTDWIIQKIYTPKGFFTPPYETVGSLRERLKSMYQKAEVKSVEGMAAFRCRKGKAE